MSTRTLRTLNEILFVIDESQMNLVKMTAQDYGINGQDRVIFLNYVCDNADVIFLGDNRNDAKRLAGFAKAFVSAS